jgi:CRP-like cAMP-binding protein
MSSPVNFWYLEEVDLFEYFCPINGAKDFYDKMPKRNFKKGDQIYMTDDDADKIFFIHEGAVKIAALQPDGQEVVRALLHPGEIFGELAVFGEEKRQEYAVALEDSMICVLEKDQAIGLMRDVAPFREFFNQLIGQRVIFTQKRLEAIIFKDARTRIIEFVLDQARKVGRVKRGVVTLPNHLTHQEISSFTGTSRQTVTTVLNQLREKELFEFDRKKFMILDMDALEAEISKS